MNSVAQKNVEIQFLRFIAIIMVIVIHAPVGMFSPYVEKYAIVLKYTHSAVGVDIFFVISGYLMGATFINKNLSCDKMSEKIIQTAQFYLKRFWRLFPASFFWITATLVVGTISKDHSLWLDTFSLYKAWVASVLSFRNFEVSLNPTHLGYYWSLSLENQFYFLLPLVWFFFRREWFWKMIVFLCVVCIFWRPGGNMWWLFRFDGLLMGLIVYKLTLIDEFRNAVRLLSPITVIGKMAMTSFICLTLPTIPIAIGAYPALAWFIVVLLSSFLVSQAALNERLIFFPHPFYPLFFWAGELTYAAYLCHIPVWLVVKDITKRFFSSQVDPYLLFGIGIILICIMSALTYFLIELPCIKLGKAQLYPPNTNEGGAEYSVKSKMKNNKAFKSIQPEVADIIFD